jgi:hypothetical protein
MNDFSALWYLIIFECGIDVESYGEAGGKWRGFRANDRFRLGAIMRVSFCRIFRFYRVFRACQGILWKEDSIIIGLWIFFLIPHLYLRNYIDYRVIFFD